MAAVSYLRLHATGPRRFGRNTEAGPQNFALERSLKCWRHYHGDDDYDCPVAARLDQLPFLPRSRECHRGACYLSKSRRPEAHLIISYELVTVPADNEPGAPIAPCGVCNMEILLLSVVLILVMITLGLAFIVLDDVKFDGRMLTVSLSD